MYSAIGETCTQVFISNKIPLIFYSFMLEIHFQFQYNKIIEKKILIIKERKTRQPSVLMSDSP